MQNIFKNDLHILNSSLFFQIIFVLGGLSSCYTTELKRRQTIAALCGETIPDYPILTIRIGTSLVVFAAVVYFLLLSNKVLIEANTSEGCLSATINLVASMLVLISAAMRLFDLSVLGQLPFSPQVQLLEETEPNS